MLPILEDSYERLQSLHAGIERTIDGLPVEAMDWVPGPEMNSLGVLATHTAGAERYWIGDVLGHEPSARDRAAEFRASGLQSAMASALLTDVLAHTEAVLERVTLADLEVQHVSTRDGRQFTGAWCLAHALAHTALHLGHMQVTRQLWDRKHSKERR